MKYHLKIQTNGKMIDTAMRIRCFLALTRWMGFAEIARKIGWRAGLRIRKLGFHWYYRRKNGFREFNGIRRISYVNPDFLKFGGEPVQSLIQRAEAIGQGRFEVHDHGVVEWDPRRRQDRKWPPEVLRSFHRHDFIVTLLRAARSSIGRIHLARLEDLMAILPTVYPASSAIRFDKPIDTAIRLLNWTAAYALTGRSPQDHIPYWTTQIEWIRAQMSPGGNHLLLEGLSLFAAGLFFPEAERSRAWKSLGYRTVVREMRRQVHPDGVHAEQSMFYHQVCTVHFFKFLLLCDRAKILVPSEFRDRFIRMLDFVRRTKKPGGGHPMIGDGDLMETEDREHWEARSLINLRLLAADRDEETWSDALHWFLDEKEKPPISPSSEVESDFWLFPEGGHGVFSDSAGHYLHFNFGSFGFRPHPHHGHADALSAEIALAGRSITMDPGGYAYRNDSIRRFVRSTRAHNTLCVEGRDQTPLLGVFGLGMPANVRLVDSGNVAEAAWMVGEHDGYAPIHHRRTVLFYRKPGFFLIQDQLRGQGEKDIALRWHFPPEFKLRSRERSGFDLMEGCRQVGFCRFRSAPLLPVQVLSQAAEGPLETGVCRRAGHFEPGVCVEIGGQASLPITIFGLFASDPDYISEPDILYERLNNLCHETPSPIDALMLSCLIRMEP